MPKFKLLFYVFTESVINTWQEKKNSLSFHFNQAAVSECLRI